MPRGILFSQQCCSKGTGFFSLKLLVLPQWHPLSSTLCFQVHNNYVEMNLPAQFWRLGISSRQNKKFSGTRSLGCCLEQNSSRKPIFLVGASMLQKEREKHNNFLNTAKLHYFFRKLYQEGFSFLMKKQGWVGGIECFCKIPWVFLKICLSFFKAWVFSLEFFFRAAKKKPAFT